MRKLEKGRLIIATHNSGKLHEISDLLSPFGFHLQSAGELGLPIPEETGMSFEENAYIKAFSAAAVMNLPALADDSGLAIDALDGAPGIDTAHWAERPDHSRDFLFGMRKIEDALHEKGALSADKRTGRFVCVICVVWPDGYADYYRGEIEGEIIWPPRGNKGFGYDPIFRPDGYDKTFGEMETEQKHGWRPSAHHGARQALSHRARAFQLFARGALGIE